MADVSLSDVTKTFRDDGDKIQAVDKLNIDIKDGEFLVLVGPSGCGKSTTLRMIAGLDQPTNGEIIINKQVVNEKKPQERDIAMVFQSYALYPHKSVSGNMAFGLNESTNLTQAEVQKSVNETSEMLDINELLNRKPSDLSGGQQQRVALGRAIVRDPEVFLLDEPLSNLDAKLRSEMRTELQRLQDDLAVTTIYVTHDQTEALTMGDRIAVLNEGSLQQVDTPLGVYHRPANLFVAGFIGEPSMNFFTSSLVNDTLENEHFEYSLSYDIHSKIQREKTVVLGIRPEDVQITNSTSGENTFSATIDVVEPRGNENTVHIYFDKKESQSKTLAATTDGMRQLDTGEQVGVHFPEDAIHIFDANSGNAIHNRKIENTNGK
jgi:multiple sugar transport system ATP-binding protein